MTIERHTSELIQSLLDAARGRGGKTLLVQGEQRQGARYWVGSRYAPTDTLFEAVLRPLLSGGYRRITAFLGKGYQHLPRWQVGDGFTLGSEVIIWLVRGEPRAAQARPAPAAASPWGEVSGFDLEGLTTGTLDRLIWRSADDPYWDRLEAFVRNRDAEIDGADGERRALVVDCGFLFPTAQELTQRTVGDHIALRDAGVQPDIERLIRSRLPRDVDGTTTDLIFFSEEAAALGLATPRAQGEPTNLAQLFRAHMSEHDWDSYRQRIESMMPHLYLGPSCEVVRAARAKAPSASTLLDWKVADEPGTAYDYLRFAEINAQARPTPRATDGHPRELSGEEVLHFSDRLHRQIIGQPKAVEAVIGSFKSLVAGTRLNTRAPMNFLMVGPTGTGKTEIAKLTSDTLSLPFYRIDMGENKGTEGIWKLMGSPQGYVGGEGMLTRYVREHPNAVILFDEVEKADPEMFDPLLTLIDEGRLADRRSDETIDFSRTVIFFTSNLISNIPPAAADDQNALREMVHATKYLRTEFVGRIQSIVPFFEFSRAHIETICRMQLESYLKKISEQRRSRPEVRIPSEVVSALTEQVDPKFGARNVRAVIEQYVAPLMTSTLFDHRGDIRLIELRAAGRAVEVHVS